MGKNTEITMIVDTKNIQSNNVDEFVKFKDNRTNPNPSSPESFTSQINEKFEVEWHGVPQDESQDKVLITEIGQKSGNGGVELLKDQPHSGKTNGALVAKVKDHYVEGQENYYIKFKINNSGPTYEVDPKLEMIKV